MGFRAKKVGKKDLYRGVNSNANAYTLIIGDNGCGKTTLLVDICNYYQKVYGDILHSEDMYLNTAVQKAKNNASKWGDVEFEYGELIPRKLICASTSQFEKFVETKRFFNDFISGGFYAYIGSKPYLPDLMPSTRIASKALQQLLRSDTFDERKLRSICHFMNDFGFENTLKLTFQATITPQEISYIELEAPLQPETQIILKKAYEHFEHDEFDRLFLDMDMIVNKSCILLRITEHRLIIHASDKNEYDVISGKDISDLLLAGFIKVENIEIVNGQGNTNHCLSQDAKLTSLASKSSGEQCLFLLFLGIISAIEDNALICIDEPEISLHPSWQQRFVNIMHAAFNEYHGCHFVIATHSPLIVSDIAVSNCEILDMTTNQLTDATTHSFLSSDYYLANVFHNPGNNNEYLISQIIETLDDICKTTNVSEAVNQKAEHLLSFKKYVTQKDKVYILLNVLERTLPRVQDK
jgi:predicted ATPase